MCNQQTGIIVTSTIIISLLLVTTALLVYHYVFSPQIENIHQLKVLSKLPQYNNIDFDTCKCQHFEENCATKIDLYASLNIQKEEICTQDKVLCCKLKENSHWNQLLYKDEEDADEADEGEIAGKENEKLNGLEVLLNKISLSKVINSSNCKCQNSEAECVKQVYIPQSLQLEMVSVCPYPNIICCNIKDDFNVEKDILNETYEKNDTDIQEDGHMLALSGQKKNTKLNENNLYLNSKLNQNLENLSNFNEGNELTLKKYILEIHHNSENEINEGSEVSTAANLHAMEIIVDLPKTYLNKSEKAENYLSNDNVYIHSNSHQDIANQNVSSNLIEYINNSLQLYDTKNTFLDNAESEMNVKNNTNMQKIDAESEMNVKNNTNNKHKIEHHKDININQITNTDNYNREDIMKYADLLFNSGINITGEELARKTNFSFLEEFNLYDILNDLNMLNFTSSVSEQGNNSNTTSDITLPIYEQGNSNFSSGTLYTPDNTVNNKSKHLFDHLFYYTYLVTFLYVISYLISFLLLIPVFSVPGIAIMQITIMSFPQIIDSHILDIISPVLKSIYGLFGVL